MNNNLPAPAPSTVRDLLRREHIKSKFQEVLNERAPQFITSLANLVYQSHQLAEADPHSVIAAALVSASLDLPVDKGLGFAAIVPYNSRRGKVAQFQMQWKGYVQLAHRSGQYRTINVTEVYEGEIKSINRFTGAIEFGVKRGESVVGYLGYFQLLNGFEKYEYMTVEEIRAHGQKFSKSFADGKSLWQTDFDAMARKTVIKRMLTRWGILSIDLKRAVAAEVPPEEEGTTVTVTPAATPEERAQRRAETNAALYGDEGDSQPPTEAVVVVDAEAEDNADVEVSLMGDDAKKGGAGTGQLAAVANEIGNEWRSWCVEFVKTFPYYADAAGQPDYFHIRGAAFKEHYPVINKETLREVQGALTARAHADMAERAERKRAKGKVPA